MDREGYQMDTMIDTCIVEGMFYGRIIAEVQKLGINTDHEAGLSSEAKILGKFKALRQYWHHGVINCTSNVLEKLKLLCN